MNRIFGHSVEYDGTLRDAGVKLAQLASSIMEARSLGLGDDVRVRIVLGPVTDPRGRQVPIGWMFGTDDPSIPVSKYELTAHFKRVEEAIISEIRAHQ